MRIDPLLGYLKADIMKQFTLAEAGWGWHYASRYGSGLPLLLLSLFSFSRSYLPSVGLYKIHRHREPSCMKSLCKRYQPAKYVHILHASDALCVYLWPLLFSRSHDDFVNVSPQFPITPYDMVKFFVQIPQSHANETCTHY